ncbi:hypothetical protein RRG08_029169 [Elysia crispata]|uniref:Uncharacterized protein n=1 Tax=Elysia crispata TaxID=231223 RepID=A0AAE1E060_9GAST|nr:hypothetical protein RRG08_029169 [Elysia crispata]
MSWTNGTSSDYEIKKAPNGQPRRAAQRNVQLLVEAKSLPRRLVSERRARDSCRSATCRSAQLTAHKKSLRRTRCADCQTREGGDIWRESYFLQGHLHPTQSSSFRNVEPPLSNERRLLNKTLG